MTSPAESKKAQIVYFSHGGGPLPILGDPGHQAMINFMRQLPSRLHRPEAVIVVSAHWEEPVATVQGAEQPEMFYDYYGFPREAYTINYPAPGNADLAERISAILQAAGILSRVDTKRGFDHGLFIPLKMMYPEADIPCLQISLLRGLDPAAHLALGKALSAFSQENILLIGSGFSFHNMQAFSWSSRDEPDPANDAFQDWLRDTITSPIDETEREELLRKWANAPSARYAHPREEHLLPLHVCQGMAGKPGELVFDDLILGKRALAFLWQE
jgi:4,5-DOPA dioxygenase extradiol